MSTSIFDKWGLSPQERRFVVIVGVVVFILVNWWVVIPMFGDWGRYNQRIADTQKLLNKYNAEISKKPEYEKRLRELLQTGPDVASEEAALRLNQDVINNANLTGLGYGTITPVNRGSSTSTGSKTNYFDEASVNVSVNTGEKELIDFLVRLADKDLLIRAKSMDISPDPSQTRLQGNLTLVKSFQRKPPQRSTTGTTGQTPPAARPGTAPPTATSVPYPSTVKPPVTSAPPARPTVPVNTNAPATPGRSLPRPIK